MNSNELCVVFRSDIAGRDFDSYDFSKLGIGKVAASRLVAPFRALTATYRSVSRRQAWASIMKYSRYLLEQGNPAEVMKRRLVLKEFLAQMAKSIRRSTAGSHYNFVAAMYQWLSVNDSANSIVWLNVDSGPCNMTREVADFRSNRLSVSDLAKVFSASKKGIEEVRAKVKAVEAALAGDLSCGLSKRDVETISGMLEGAKYGVVGKLDLVARHLVHPHCDFRRMRRYAFLEVNDFMPYLICLICQTLANPNSAMELSIDCIGEHPVDPLKRRIVWDKYRSGRQQVLDVSTDGRYAVPLLVEELLQRTQCIRGMAGAFSNHLFIWPSGSNVRTPSVQSWHHGIERFILKNGLPDFNFVDIRASGAEVLSNSGDSIEALQRKMQHRDSRTTRLYLNRHPPSPQARRMIAGFIGKVVKATALPVRNRYETTIGMQCSDPLSGIAPRSTAGQECLQYMQCATCPNSVVVIDSEKHVARMLVALSALQKMKERAARSIAVRARYEAAYRTTHEVVLALIAKVPSEVKKTAERLARKIRQLELE